MKKAVAVGLMWLFLSGCTRCQQVGALAGAGWAGLGVVTGAYVSDSLVNLPRKCGGDSFPTGGCFHNGGEPLHEVFDHHVRTTDNIMLYGGLFAIPFGALMGTIASHAYCDSPDSPTPWSSLL